MKYSLSRFVLLLWPLAGAALGASTLMHSWIACINLGYSICYFLVWFLCWSYTQFPATFTARLCIWKPRWLNPSMLRWSWLMLSCIYSCCNYREEEKRGDVREGRIYDQWMNHWISDNGDTENVFNAGEYNATKRMNPKAGSLCSFEEKVQSNAQTWGVWYGKHSIYKCITYRGLLLMPYLRWKEIISKKFGYFFLF